MLVYHSFRDFSSGLDGSIRYRIALMSTKKSVIELCKFPDFNLIVIRKIAKFNCRFLCNIDAIINLIESCEQQEKALSRGVNRLGLEAIIN